MTYQEFDNKFKKEVANWSYERQLDLALDICKKLFYDYQQFYEENKWGNPDIVLDAISLAERCKNGGEEKNLLANTIRSIEEVTPDTEDFEEANYALNACVAIFYTLKFLLENKPEHIYYVGTTLYDTIYAKVQTDNDLSDEEINRHSMMVETRRYLLQEA